MISLILDLIYPLYWPYPVLPQLIGEKMLSFLDSPVPLLAGLEIGPSRFESFVRGRKIHKQEVHISLDRNRVIGDLKYDLKDDILKKTQAGLQNYKRMKELHERIVKEEENSDYEKIYAYLTSKPEHLSNHIEYLRCFQQWIQTFYVDPLKYLDTSYLRIKQENETQQPRVFCEFMKTLPGVTAVHTYMYSGQIVQTYIEDLLTK